MAPGRDQRLDPATLEVGAVFNGCAVETVDQGTWLRIGTTEGCFSAPGLLPAELGRVPQGERAKVVITNIDRDENNRLSLTLGLA